MSNAYHYDREAQWYANQKPNKTSGNVGGGSNTGSNNGLWNNDRVRTVVGNVISEDEYKEITGEDVSAYGGSPDPSNTIINNKWN